MSLFSEIINKLKPNPIIAIGGFLTLRKPMSLIRQLAECQRSDLIILTLSGSFEIDYLLKHELVTELIAPYVGCEMIAPVTPIFRSWCIEGRIKADPWDTAMLVQSLKASGENKPFTYWQPGIGTDIPLNNQRMKVEINPETQREEIRIDSIKPDLALIHGSFADHNGNAFINGAAWGDMLLAEVSEKVVVSVEEKIENKSDELEYLNRISSDKIDLLLEIPDCAKPFESPGYYQSDPVGLRNLSYQSEC